MDSNLYKIIQKLKRSEDGWRRRSYGEGVSVVLTTLPHHRSSAKVEMAKKVSIYVEAATRTP